SNTDYIREASYEHLTLREAMLVKDALAFDLPVGTYLSITKDTPKPNSQTWGMSYADTLDEPGELGESDQLDTMSFAQFEALENKRISAEKSEEPNQVLLSFCKKNTIRAMPED